MSIKKITADEVIYAGGITGANNTNYYLYDNASKGVSSWRTMTPYSWYYATGEANCHYTNCSGPLSHSICKICSSPTYEYARNYAIGGTSNGGRAHYANMISSYGVRPVISLKSCVEWSNGNGTSGSPYTVKIGNSCTLKEN